MPGLLVVLSTQLFDTSSQTAIAEPSSGDSAEIKATESSTFTAESAENDAIPFFTSLLLGSDVGVRTWISAFIKAGQKV